jgi:hypothetical protein
VRFSKLLDDEKGFRDGDVSGAFFFCRGSPVGLRLVFA